MSADVRSSLPRSRPFWVCIALAAALVALGAVIGTGVVAGVLGLWGGSLFVLAVVGYGGYRLWYDSGL